MPLFAKITDLFDAPPNPLYKLRDERIRKGLRLTDLISGNVNTQGIFFPPKILGKALYSGVRAAEIYRPDPLGQPAARKAIRRYYNTEGLQIPEDQIVITPGTSISYWYAFKLLANPGDDILCPCPSYPLFETIASLSGIRLTSYRLRERQRWEIDFDDLTAAVTPKTKAIILISPHNPTGAVATEDEIKKLAALAAAKNLPIISDEVFSPFLFDRDCLPRPARTEAPLVLTLNGLSKMAALPGLKIGWMALTGDPSLVKKSLKTLEMISDTFLPVNETAQYAVPHLLRKGKHFLNTYALEIEKRMSCAIEVLKGRKDISFIKPEGGFFMTLRLDGKKADEEDRAYQLLQKHGILVHPGYLYDMEGQHLIFSFVSKPAILREALRNL
jgi:alanine-synthesizing transaminase